jgi:hypothetical protein
VNFSFVISHGTFGFWTAYLAGGDVVVADGYYKKSHILIEASKVLGWTLMWDPCFKKKANTNVGGDLTEDCLRNSVLYGITSPVQG